MQEYPYYRASMIHCVPIDSEHKFIIYREDSNVGYGFIMFYGLSEICESEYVFCIALGKRDISSHEYVEIIETFIKHKAHFFGIQKNLGRCGMFVEEFFKVEHQETEEVS